MNATEQRALFLGILQRLADAGEVDVTPSRLLELWRPEFGDTYNVQSPRVARLISSAINDGHIERIARGCYRITLHAA